MTPKEKAKELTDKYYNFGDQEFDYSKDFALIAVDEIINSQKCCDECKEEGSIEMKYWNEVKHEIEKL